MVYGYTGKILRVDLTEGATSVEEPGEDFYRRYLGGTALASYYLLKEQKPKIDAFSPENKLILATGVITGAPVGVHNAVCTKSPMSNAFNTSEVGGYWGAELKRAGYDTIIIEGKAKKPVYLWIQDGKVEIRDATHLWGKSIGETQEMMRRELGDPGVRTALIGPGGEKRVRYACLVNDLGHFAGRGGSGAVMGSKNLKGVAVRGHKLPPMADPEAMNNIGKWFSGLIKTDPILMGMHAVGTITGPQAYSQAGGYCVNNFQEGVSADADKISPESYMSEEGLGSKMYGCYACPVRCKHRVAIKNNHHLKFDYYHGHGPEYESLTSLGPFCGVGDLQAIACANELCTAYGIDTISCGATIACAMECFQRGLITEKDTGGLKLEFGSAEAMLKAVEMICQREGFGDTLAEGSLRFAQKIGNGAEQYSMQARGVELAMQNPFFKPILGLGYAMCPTGGDHMRNLVFIHVIDAEKAGVGTHSEARDSLLRQYRSLGLIAPVYRKYVNTPANIRELIYVSIYSTVLDSLGMCIFASWGIPYHQVAELVNKVTGWDTTMFELMKCGERAINMMRIFNNREGFTRDDDRIPERFHKPLGSGPLKDVRLDKGEFEKAKSVYYGMMGWDDYGKPSRGKLQELDIEWTAE
jgi:aldehyde:ferredoxin oxidoreductase